jgi:hypothetical protein
MAACLVCPSEGTGKLIPAALVLDLSIFHLATFLVRQVASRVMKKS